MAASAKSPLLSLGPVAGMDSATAGPYVDASRAALLSNIDPRRIPGAIVTARGRVTLATLKGASAITGVAELVADQNTRYLVAGLLEGSVFSFNLDLPIVDPNNPDSTILVVGSQHAVTNGIGFSQAVQFGGVLFTNAGQQIGQVPKFGPLGAFPWQYTIADTGFSVASLSGTGVSFATGSCTVGGTFATSDTLTTTIGGIAVVYTVKNTDTTNTLIATGVAAAINADPNASLLVGAVGSGTSVNLTAVTTGSAGNAITLTCTKNSTSGTYVASGTTLSGGKGSGETYNYAYTVVVHPPYAQTGGPNQESTQFGATPPPGSGYPLTTISTGGTPKNTLTATGGIWNGTLTDGSSWYANLYRSSSAQPQWFLVATGGTPASSSVGQLSNGSTFLDTLSDATISANPFLGNGGIPFYQDPPPTSTVQPCAIFTHKERTWCFATVQNSDTGFTVQSQLWYSQYGEPWSFDRVNSVLLVGTADTPAQTVLVPTLGDYAVAGCSLSSVGVLFKRRSLWILYGDDPNTFVVRKVGQFGCFAPLSVAVAQDMAFFLSEEGVFSFDGASAPQYISERIKDQLESIGSDAWPYAVGWFSDKTYYLSFPNVVPAPPVPEAVTDSGTAHRPIQYVGSGSVANLGAGQQTTPQPAKTCSATVACVGGLHKPNPNDPDTWFWSYNCILANSATASWTVSPSVAPTTATTPLTAVLTGSVGTAKVGLKLTSPTGVVLQDFGNVGVNQIHSWFKAGATIGTYTWTAYAVIDGDLGPQDTSTAGTYSATVSITTGTPTNGSTSTNGPVRGFKTLPVLAPTTADTELTLALANLVLPADKYATTALSVTLLDPNGAVASGPTTVSAATTLSYWSAAAIGGIYVWQIALIVTPTATLGTSTYNGSAQLTLGWWSDFVGSNRLVVSPNPITFAYYLPTQEWFSYPYAAGTALATASENSPNTKLQVTEQRANMVLAAPPMSLRVDAWEAAETDLRKNVVGSALSPMSYSGMPAARKEYSLLAISGPISQCTINATLLIDPTEPQPPDRIQTWTVRLADTTAAIWTVAVNDDSSGQGFLGQLRLDLENDGVNPAVVYFFGAYGDIQDNLVPLDNGSVES